MNEASLKYTAYKALLEGDITREQYNFITEAGTLTLDPEYVAAVEAMHEQYLAEAAKKQTEAELVRDVLT